MKITTMKISDYDQAYSLWAKTEGMGLHNDVDCKKGIGRFLRHNPGLSVVAKDDDKIIGTLLCSFDGRRGHLLHLAVSKDYRKQGIGKKLVDKVMSKLQAMSVRRCILCTYRTNRTGMKFWKHLGWTGRTDVILMSKNISKCNDSNCC
jgi:ribosomal protein S18 acetylase RimI-like enzyme